MVKPQRQAVYLCCLNLFRGENAKLRNSKKIKKILEKNNPIIASLRLSHTFGEICEVAKELLEEGLFGSTIKAEICFPDLFQVSPVRNAQRAESEAEAARSEAEAIEEAISSEDEAIVAPEDRVEEQASISIVASRQDSNGRCNLRSVKSVHSDEVHPTPQATISERVTFATKSLYPLYLPYRTQHRILCTAQGILEEACFEFAKVSLPEFLAQKRWECAESGELTEWLKVFRSHRPEILGAGANGMSEETWKGLLRKASQLRHTAVHRLRTTAPGTIRLLESGRALLEALNDDTRAACIQVIEADLRLTIDEMERNTRLLEVKMERQQIELAEKRAELGRLEQQMIADMLRDSVESRSALGSELEYLLLKRTNQGPADCPFQETGLQEAAENHTPSEPDFGGNHADENTDQLQPTDPVKPPPPSSLTLEYYTSEELDGSPGVTVDKGLASPEYFAELKSWDDEFHDADEVAN
ncbi:MAG: hypothetical protein Q9187_003492 [Circinaria calcarea]